MWAGAVLADSVTNEVIDFGGVHLVPASDPIAVAELAHRLDVGWLVVVAHPALARRADLAVALAAGSVPGRHFTRFTSAHAPLATVCALAQARASFAHPGRAIGLARAVLDRSWSAAWTPKVSQLHRPAPTVAQHLRSLLPGGGFLIRHLPDPQVVTGHPASVLAGLGSGRVLVTEEGIPAELGAQLLAGSADSTRRLSLPGNWKSVYGTDRAVQLALMPADIDPLIEPVTHLCPSCSLELSMPHCPFCRVAATPRSTTGRIPVLQR